MPLLAGLFAGLFGSLASFFATWVTKKTAFGLAAVAVFATLTVALMVVISASIAAVMSLPSLPAAVLFGMQLFMPSNFSACMAAIFAGDAAVALYKWNCENLRLVAYVT